MPPFLNNICVLRSNSGIRSQKNWLDISIGFLPQLGIACRDEAIYLTLWDIS